MIFLKEKAVSMCFIMIIAIVAFSYFVSEVNAEDENTNGDANKVCCEITKGGETCQYTTQDQCNPGYRVSASSCEASSFCKLGCCYDKNDGACYKNTPQPTCASKDGLFSADPLCQVPECQKNCCVIGDQCFMSTQLECKNAVSNFPYLSMDFRDATSELECVGYCQGQDHGCCSLGLGECSWTTRDDCESRQALTSQGIQFNFNTYCSDSSLGCDCTKQYKTQCVGEDVYYFDSCGNMEGIADDCDYAKGTLCKQIDNNTASCSSLDCTSTYTDEKNVHDARLGGFRMNGESWCIYEGPTGNWTDAVGSRHYRHLCINGEEVYEECKDYREEICLQGKASADRGSYAAAACIENWNTSITTVPEGFKFWDTEDETVAETCSEANIEAHYFYYKKNTFADWHEINQETLQQKFADNVLLYCKSKGDCGPAYNVELVKGGLDSFDLKSAYQDNWDPSGPPKWMVRSADGNLEYSGVPEYLWNYWATYGVHGGLSVMMDVLGSISDAVLSEMNTIGTINQFGAYGGIAATLISIYILVFATATVTVGAVTFTGGTISILALAAAKGALGSVVAGSGWLGVIPIWGWIVLAIILIITWLVTSGSEQHEHIFTSICAPWTAPKENKCEECTGPFKVCSEYKCRSLGADCKLVNEGTGNETCVVAHPNDVNAPMIKPWLEVLNKEYQIQDGAQSGYNILPLVDPFKPITFGIETSEPAQCKVDTNADIQYPKKFEEMPASYFEDVMFRLNHTMTISVMEPNTEYSYAIKCSDYQGNDNPIYYVIKYKTKEGPDLTAPVIENVSLKDGAFIPFNVTYSPLTVTLNEPGTCRVDTIDTDYELMQYGGLSANSYSNFGFNALIILPNISKGANQYYIRCQDRYGNTNQQSYPISVIGTDELKITFVEPTMGKEIYSTNAELKLGTFGGAEGGKAICSFAEKGRGMIEMMETSSSVHRQLLQGLKLGEYNYNFECTDIAGNVASNATKFRITVDTSAPLLLGIFRDTELRIELSEITTCQYSNMTFSYGQGYDMSGINTTLHGAPLSTTAYHVKCIDQYGNAMTEIIVYS